MLKLALSFVTLVGCDRAQPSETATPETPPDQTSTPVESSAAAPEQDLLDIETVGDLKLGLPTSAAEAALGKPEKEGEAFVAEATGDEVKDWSYPKRGINIGLVKVQGGWEIDAIYLQSPCPMKTSRGIAIGSPREDVEREYAKWKNPEQSDENRFVAGSLFGGVVFDFKEGKVLSIFVGVSAE